MGYAQRLSNGNTLITELEGGEGVGGDEHGDMYVIGLPSREGRFSDQLGA